MARTPIHPGEVLADELKELGVSAAELARILHVPTSRITQIIAGKRGVTADTALRLGRWLGTGPELWMNLQKSYELQLAQQQIGKEIERTIPRQSSAPSESALAHT
jgi:addiction module HigA family antidote